MKSLRTIHLVVGLVGVTLFLLSGQYMQHALGKLVGMEAGQRMLIRSAHVYLLWSSLLNLMLGCYLQRVQRGFLRVGQSLASIALILGPALFCFAFFYEPYLQGLARPFAGAAIYAAFGGCIMHALIAMVARKNGLIFNSSLDTDASHGAA